jgi:hypothetical protein
MTKWAGHQKRKAHESIAARYLQAAIDALRKDQATSWEIGSPQDHHRQRICTGGGRTIANHHTIRQTPRGLPAGVIVNISGTQTPSTLNHPQSRLPSGTAVHALAIGNFVVVWAMGPSAVCTFPAPACENGTHLVADFSYAGNGHVLGALARRRAVTVGNEKHVIIICRIGPASFGIPPFPLAKVRVPPVFNVLAVATAIGTSLSTYISVDFPLFLC